MRQKTHEHLGHSPQSGSSKRGERGPKMNTKKKRKPVNVLVIRLNLEVPRRETNGAQNKHERNKKPTNAQVIHFNPEVPRREVNRGPKQT